MIGAYELITAVTALSISIAEEFPDNDDLDTLGSIFVQLGETLETIALQRETQERHNRRCSRDAPEIRDE